MIASLSGTVLAVAGTTAIIEVGGVGLQVAVTPAHALELRVGGDAHIRTALVVREDELALYGFADDDGKEVFDLLRGVNGVGPKSAMAVLAALSPADIAALRLRWPSGGSDPRSDFVPGTPPARD